MYKTNYKLFKLYANDDIHYSVFDKLHWLMLNKYSYRCTIIVKNIVVLYLAKRSPSAQTTRKPEIKSQPSLCF